MIEILVFVLIIILLTYFINWIKGKFKLKRKERLNHELTIKINQKQKQLELLEKELNNRKIDNSVNLTNATVKVLDIYSQSGIRIPKDIIEELSYMRFVEEKDIFDFIENQRHFWVLENRKKPYRKVK